MAKRRRRIVAIDAARGAAMLLSCLAHFAWWIELAYPGASGALSSIGMIATPTFLLLSGAMTGSLLARQNLDASRVKFKLLNRGLFLLTFGHVLVALTEWHRQGSLVRAIAGASIVDEIGLAMTLAGLYSTSLSKAPVRRIVGIAAFITLCACWLMIQRAPVDHEFSVLTVRALLGAKFTDAYPPSYLAPTVQYVALFALGLSLTELITGRRSPTPLLKFGVALVIAAVSARLVRFALDDSRNFAYREAIDGAITFSGKTPPTPGYLMFYCGVGLMMIGAFMAAWRSRDAIARTCIEWLAVIGRASLFAFVLQYFLYWTLPDWLGIQPGPWSGLLYVVNVLVLWTACRAWTAIGGNRFLTVGLRPRVAAAGAH